MYNNNTTTTLREFTIVRITTTTTTTSHTIDYSAYVFTNVMAVVPIVVKNIANVTTVCFPILKSFTNTQAVVAVAESNTDGVLLGGTVEGLELVSNINVTLLIIGI